MVRRALVVGIDYYDDHSFPALTGCVGDAEAIADLLRTHSNKDRNYDCDVRKASDAGTRITRPILRQALDKLFSEDFKGEILFYFSGHGVISSTGGYLATSDAEENDVGIPMSEIIEYANQSNACDVFIILDCCHAGALANAAGRSPNPFATMREGITIIASAGARQQAMEEGGHGLFTAATIDALDGGGADHMGWVTPPSIYAYVERRFGAHEQRPVYKTHTNHLAVIRRCAPIIANEDLRELTDHFPTQNSRFPLDPEYEPEDGDGNVAGPVNEEKIRIAHLFKRYRDAGLLLPVEDGEQLFWTARWSHEVKLTPRGKEYWGRVSRRGV